MRISIIRLCGMVKWGVIQLLVVFTYIPMLETRSRGCDICQTNPDSCRVITGQFSVRHPARGYTPITKIPARACNINITEHGPSSNFIVLKTSFGGNIINSKYSISAPGKYWASGTTFRYWRGGDCPGECVTSTGPTRKEVYLELLSYHTNPGLTYTYTTIKKTAGQQRLRLKPARRYQSRRTRNNRQFSRLSTKSESVPETRHYLPQNTVLKNKKGSEPANKSNNVRTRTDQRNTHNLDDIQKSASESQGNTNNQNSQPPTTVQKPHEDNHLTEGRHHRRIQFEKPPQSKQDAGRGVDAHQSIYNQYPYRPKEAVSGPNISPNKQHPQRKDSSNRHSSDYQELQVKEEPRYYESRSRETGYESYPSLGLVDRPVYSRDFDGKDTSIKLVQPKSDNTYPIPEDAENRKKLFISSNSRDDVREENIFIDNAKSVFGEDDEHVQHNSPYTWGISGLSECSMTCGGGTQSTVVVCLTTKTGVVVTSDNCDEDTKPETREVRCGNKPCPAAWIIGEWTPCSVTCGEGTQKRMVSCQRRISSGVEIGVSASHCPAQSKPATRQQCRAGICAAWRALDWGKCSVECGKGKRKRRVDCVDGNGEAITKKKCTDHKPRSEESCDMGPCSKQWYFSTWSNQCSSDCGSGYLSRWVFCLDEEGQKLSELECDLSKRPEAQKACTGTALCTGYWFVGTWDKCSVECGTGIRRREVVCMSRQGDTLTAPLSEENCDPKEKPNYEEACAQDVCGMHWFMTEWTQCSVTCGAGFQTRDVDCLDALQTRGASCDSTMRPKSRLSCNTQQCAIKKSSKTDPTCKDKYSHCRLVVQARLCKYPYYRGICCGSCSH